MNLTLLIVGVVGLWFLSGCAGTTTSSLKYKDKDRNVQHDFKNVR